jgi:molybdopterin/thiamine biosynthesis adenylyltransferase/rhodanese-related sulfurtransferase
MSDRYARQRVLAEVGEAGQARLAAAAVLVVGVGGLGSPVLATLAGAGVGRLVVVDHDRVEASNLHRQPLFRMADLGRPKAEAARDALLAYNPEVAVEAEAVRLDPANAARLVARAGIVVDAADSLAVTYMLSDACRDAEKPLVSASVLGQQGYVGAFCGGGPSYRAVFPDMPATVGSCPANGVLGSAVAVVGALQAHMVLQLILRLAPSPLGRLVSVDLGRLAFGGFGFAGAQEPVVASLPFIARTALSPVDHVVELRGADEAPRPVTETAVRLTVEQVEWGDIDLPRDRRVVFCCRSGVRAHRAARALEARGFTNLALLALGA